jgi:hypothetical protein
MKAARVRKVVQNFAQSGTVILSNYQTASW